MAYTALFEGSDISAVVIDFIVGIGSALVGFVTLIGLIMLYNYVRQNV